jgi:hypothetical protein
MWAPEFGRLTCQKREYRRGTLPLAEPRFGVLLVSDARASDFDGGETPRNQKLPPVRSLVPRICPLQ